MDNYYISGPSKCKRAGVEDIPNQPPCYSNKMKKYIRSKNAVVPDTCPAHAGNTSKEERVKPEVQPPLPPGPPPPDRLPMGLTLKEEVVDVEYNSPGEEPSDAINVSELTDEFKAKESENPNKSMNKQRTMCRDFIRGKCTRLATCKFSHKCDVSQLAGVYTFCNDYQNSVCTRPNCKYVHATVFEEQRFYRTGELPPHAFAHHKKMNLLPPPPPPPPEDPPAGIQTNFKVPPPPLPVRAFPDDLRAASSGSSTSRLMRNSPNIGNFGSLPSNMQHEPNQSRKRCGNCELLELREELLVEKINKTKISIQEKRHDIEILARKRERLDAVLTTLLWPAYQGNLGGGLLASQNNTGEIQKRLMDQINNARINNLITGMQEGSNRNALNANLNVSNLLSKLLNARQNILDASRNN